MVKLFLHKERYYMRDGLLKDFYNGNCFDGYRYYGAHLVKEDNLEGVRFSVYAPNALRVQIIGEFNGWTGEYHEMNRVDMKGTYSLFIPKVKEGMMYKYRVFQATGDVVDKADPYGFYSELRPNTASIVSDINNFIFTDDNWMKNRTKNFDKALNIYELHLGSWRRKEDGSWLSYEEISYDLVEYLLNNNYTHIEIMPLNEHPFDGSWGYQSSGYFSATSRYGSINDLKALIDRCHNNNIGVIMDFVPIHFVRDNYCLAKFDGTCLYEYNHNDISYSEWGSCNFDYYKKCVQSFLKSAAAFWLDVYHIDGLRMDAISNAIYWQGDNKRGVNQGAIDFIKKLNTGLNTLYPTAMYIAEDSSNYTKVTTPVFEGGLGFDYKWDLGWMNDTLKYYETDPIYRKYDHNKINFSMLYYFSEKYILPLSHDEVVHGKKSIIDKMWGSYEQKFSQCRNLYIYMMTHPGKKLNFMGNEIGHFREWDEDRELDWLLLEYPMHNAFNKFIKDLNEIYKKYPAFYEFDYDYNGFKWIDADNRKENVFTYSRYSKDSQFVVALNMCPNNYENFKVGVDSLGTAVEIINSEDNKYNGCNITNKEEIKIERIPYNGLPYSFKINLAPFAGIVFKIKK